MFVLVMVMSGVVIHSLGYQLSSRNYSVQEIPFENLTSVGTFFESTGVKMYESFVYDSLRNQIILGAENFLLRLDTNLELLEKHEIPVPSERMRECKRRHSEEDCQNFMPVLHIMFDVDRNESLVYACGSYAFDPMCFVRDADDLSNPKKKMDIPGEHKAPKSPTYRGVCSSWLNAGKNLLFLGTSLDADVQSSDIAVSEMSDTPTFKPKRIRGSLELQNAEFAGSFQFDKFVYFVYSEDAFENGKKEISSRISRVCADGDGENPTFVSFTKVRLECGDYDDVRGIYFLETESKLFATFSKRLQGDAKSAVCQYNYSDISSAFDANFRCQKEPESPWEVCPPRPLGAKNVKTCYGDRNIEDVEDRILLDTTVRPYCGGPVFETVEGSILFGELDVQRSTAGFQGYKAYVGEDRTGKVWNINLGQCDQSEAYEIWEVTRPADRDYSLEVTSVKNLLDSVYVLTCCGLMKYPGLNFIPTTEGITLPPALANSTHPYSSPNPAPLKHQARGWKDKTTPIPEPSRSIVKPASSLLLTMVLAIANLRRLK